MMTTEDKGLAELKDKLSTAISILHWELADMLGHVSVRTPDRKHLLLRFLRAPIDPSIPEDDVLTFDYDGNWVSGRREPGRADTKAKGPGLELYFHTYPYKAREDVGAVIHVHPMMVVALTATGKKICAFQHRQKFGKGVPVTPWLWGSSAEDAERATKAMGESCAVIIEGHGAIVTGKTLEEACINAVQLERAAKMIMLAGSLGEVKPVPDAAVERFQSIVEPSRSGPKRPVAEWRFYETMIKRGERWRVL